MVLARSTDRLHVDSSLASGLDDSGAHDAELTAFLEPTTTEGLVLTGATALRSIPE